MKRDLIFLLQLCLAMSIQILAIITCCIAADLHERSLPVDAVYYNYDNSPPERIILPHAGISAESDDNLLCENDGSYKNREAVYVRDNFSYRAEEHFQSKSDLSYKSGVLKRDEARILVRVVKDGVYLQSRKNYGMDFRLFELPVSWFLFAQSDGGRYYRITVPDSSVTGYVLKSDVSVCREEPSMPFYPTVQTDVAVQNAVMYEKPDSTSVSSHILRKGDTVRVLGSIVTSCEWYYVEVEGVTGYVRSDRVTPIEFTFHSEPIASEEGVKIQEEEKIVVSEQWAMTVFIISFLCIAVIVAILPTAKRFFKEQGAFEEKSRPVIDKNVSVGNRISR